MGDASDSGTLRPRHGDNAGAACFHDLSFETAWTKARAGTLHIGDVAPNFSLAKLDKNDAIRLSSFTEQHRPVVLIFGSYT